MSAVADTTDGPWVYLPRLTPEEQAVKDAVKGCATGVITNGDWRLFVFAKEASKTMELTLYSDGWASPVTGVYIAGQGRLDLSLPIVSEDGQSSYAMTVVRPNCFRTGTSPTELIYPRTATSIGNFTFYLNGGNLTNLVVDCPELTSLGQGIVYKGKKLTSLTLNCPKLTTIDVDAFYQCTSLSNWTVNLPKVTNYRANCFFQTLLRGVDPDGFNLPNVTNLAQYAFSAFSGTTGMTGSALRLDRLQAIGEEALSHAKFDAVLLGYDNLSRVAANAMKQMTANTLVIGAGPAPVVIGASAIPAGSHRLWFRGGVPSTEGGSIQMDGAYWTTIFVRADESDWFDLPIRAATGEELRIFRERNPDLPDDRIIGILPMDTIGNVRDMFVLYGDYRTEESRLFVEVDARYAAQCPVTPAAGMHADEFAAGSKIVLTAPDDVVQIGDFKVKASKYVVSEIDDYGRWTKNVTTNDYVVGSENAVTMPAKGSLKIEWIFDKAYAVKLAPLLTKWYPDKVTCGGEDVTGDIWVAKGGTCILVARPETDGQPKTRFLRWEGDIGDADPENPTLSLTVTDVVRVKAVFAHDWYMETEPTTSSPDWDVTMTDGNWVLKVRRQSDIDGRRRISVGRGYDNTAIVSGEGPMDLSTRVTDSAGNEYFIHTIAYNAFRPGSCGNPDQNACTDFTAPTDLVSLGEYVFYFANTALTNVTLNCPELTSASSGAFMGCSKVRRVYFNAPKLTAIPNGDFWTGLFYSCDSLVDLTLNLPLLRQLPMKFLTTSPLTDTDCSQWHLESVTNVCDCFMGYSIKSSGPHGELRLPSLEALTGSRQFSDRTGITKLVLGSGKLRLLGSQGGVPSSTDSQTTCRPGNALINMTGLRHIELGLAPDAVIPDGVFDGLGANKVTNLTFTAAPPSNTNIFAAVAKATTVPTDGTKTVTVWANGDHPGWRTYTGEFATTAAELGILGLGDLTDAERAVYDAMPRTTRKRWMGLVYDFKRFGWLMNSGNITSGILMCVF